MALTVQANSKSVDIHGYDGCKVERGVFAFTTTATGGELPVKMRQVHAVQLTPVGTQPASDEQPFVDETFKDGICQVPSSGTLTITRPATGTSGQQYAYTIWGV